MYLTAVIDWYSRYVLSWRLSNTLDGGFCLEALDEALSRGTPEIFHTDLGSQFTSREYTGRLEQAGIAESRDARGRALDNVFAVRPKSGSFDMRGCGGRAAHSFGIIGATRG